uniref:Uncharacterized protein n=1 Tax=Globisporangium ultimum (strain ATCC 200006 / CBS 805.95 / DAOM BR144) TaxID=431595 RepID=K3WJH3_GLOUD
MAAYHPSLQEMLDEQTEQGASDKKEDALLDNVSDFFENDLALQNLLDEEKWLTLNEKAAKRKALMQERLRICKDKPSSSGGARESPATLRDSNEEPAKLTSEDYITTAEYIEALMKEVSDEESKLLAGVEQSDMHIAQTARSFNEMKASWNFAQYRSQSRATSARISASRKAEGQHMLEHVEPSRRDEWINSGYIQRLSASEKQAHQNHHQTNPLRFPYVPKVQTLHIHEQHLPWKPLWEVAIGDDELNDEQYGKSKSDQQSPATYAPMNPRPPSSERPRTASTSLASGCSTASQSATFSYINRKKIYSAASARVYQATDTYRESFSPVATPDEKCKSPCRFDYAESVPIDSLNSISNLKLSSVEGTFTKHINTPSRTSNGSEANPKEAEASQNSSIGISQVTRTTANLSNADAQQLRAEKVDAISHASATKKVTTSKKKRRSRRTQDHARKRFDLQL